MIMKRYIALALIALAAVGCNNDDSALNPNEIRIDASLGGTRATLTSFEAGDKMSLYAVEYNGDNVAELQTAGT